MKKRLLLIATAGNFSAKWGWRGEGGVGDRGMAVSDGVVCQPLKLPIIDNFLISLNY